MALTNPPDGFFMEHEAVPETSWDLLRKWMREDNSIPWEIAIEGRRVAQFGCRYSYTDQKVDHSPAVPIPNVLRDLFPRLKNDNGEYTQCIINCYGPNDGIPFHMDDKDFGENVLVYTFLEARPLCMRHLREKSCDECPPEGDNDTFTAYPRHRSCYQLSGEARWHWEHSVPEGSDERISITFRSIQQKVFDAT